MPKNKIIIVLGVLVASFPLLGFPTSWERFFQVLLGLSIVALSMWSTIDKRLTLKARAQRRAQYRKTQSDMQSDIIVANNEPSGESPNVPEQQ